ncbi:MAG: PAS domain S-box protein, partial [Paracoccaceae bacterium]|nr:PAS domain S-box protein [Paracoccaceae bacterium]
MRKPKFKLPMISRTLAVLAGLVAFIAIGFLSYDVARKIRLLGSASSDNVQWSLTQTEVEFLALQNQIEADPVDLGQLRERFDIFYSRIGMVNRAAVFAELRANEISSAHLDAIAAFLDETVALIDADDAVLLAGLPTLAQRSEQLRPIVRAMSLSGLRLFAETADEQRQAVARTLTELAVALAALIGALALAIVYLYRLNIRIFNRELENNQTATRMRTVMGTSLDGVIISDGEGRILEFSPAAEAIFGHKTADVLGLEVGEVIVPDHMRAAHDTGMERMRKGGERHVVGKGRVRLDAKRANGEVFPVELALQSATTDQGQIFIAFLRDISHRVAAEAELVAARDKALASEKMKTDFLATMSHEIRTPLNGLLGNKSLLRDTPLNNLQDRYVGYMESSGRLLMSHISDVLDITRYDAGKLSTMTAPMNISA